MNLTTIINTPAPAPAVKTEGGMGMILGLIVLGFAVFIFFVYGLPAIRRIGSPQINIPSKIELNVNQQTK